MDRINECNTLISWKFWSHWAKRHSNTMKSNIDCPLKEAWPPVFAQPFLYSPCSGCGKVIQSLPLGCPLPVERWACCCACTNQSFQFRVARQVFAGNSDKTAWEDWILSYCLSNREETDFSMMSQPRGLKVWGLESFIGSLPCMCGKWCPGSLSVELFV